MTTDAAEAGGRRGEAGGRAIQIAGLKDLTWVSGFAHSESWKGVELRG